MKYEVIFLTGLVLEGGGVRGIYVAGVLDVFMEHGLCFDGIVGVSAGAIHAVSYLSGQHGRSIRYYKKYLGDPRFMSIKSLIKTGDIVGADFCYHELPEQLDIYDFEAFSKNATPFYVTVSNVETGEAEYIRLTDMKEEIDYLRASASLPYFSRIVEVGQKKYLDGGCTDSIPVEAFFNMGYERNVVVLTRDAQYRKKEEMRLFQKLFYRRYPKFIDALRARHIKYNATLARIAELEREGKVFVIRPMEPLDIGRLDKDTENVQRVYDVGRADALTKLEELKAWIEN